MTLQQNLTSHKLQQGISQLSHVHWDFSNFTYRQVELSRFVEVGARQDVTVKKKKNKKFAVCEDTTTKAQTMDYG